MGYWEANKILSFIDECIEGLLRVNASNYDQPINLGSDERISIADLAKMIILLSGKKVEIDFITGPTGVEGRSSDNSQIQSVLGWATTQPLSIGIEKTYQWILGQLNLNSTNAQIIATQPNAA